MVTIALPNLTILQPISGIKGRLAWSTFKKHVGEEESCWYKES